MKDQFVIGVDGGGSSTTAWLAKATGPAVPLGIGKSGGSNPIQTKNIEVAFENIEAAIASAFGAADKPRCKVAVAVLALAGSGRAEVQKRFVEIARSRGISDEVLVVSDVTPLLELTSRPGPAIALVSGTGSIGIGRDANGNVRRSGGWGHLFGDEGSGFAMGVAALRAVALAHDGRGAATSLSDILCEFFSVPSPPLLIGVIYDDNFRRQKIARLASFVIAAANDGDTVAKSIVDSSVQAMMLLLQSLIPDSEDPAEPWSLILSGGLFVHERSWFNRIATTAKNAHPSIDEIILVEEPTQGAVLLAQAEFKRLHI